MRKLPLLFLSATALSAGAADFNWTGPSDGIWGEALWNSSAYFQDGGNAIFAGESSASVVLDGDAVVTKIAASEDAAFSAVASDPDAWKTAYRYYRFIIDGSKSDGNNMQVADIILIDENGDDVPSTAFTLEHDPDAHGVDRGAYPDREAPKYAIDANTNTKWLDWRAGLNRTSEQNAAVYLEFRFPEAVRLSGYKWFTANDSDGRDLVAWRLLASHDGVRWVVVDKVKNYQPPQDRKTLAFQRCFAGFSKYRFKIDALRDNGGTMQISDVSLYGKDGSRLVMGVDFTVSYADGTSNPTAGEGILKAVDSNSDGSIKTNSKWLDHRLANTDTKDNVWIQFNMTQPRNISAYSWSTCNDTSKYPNRNPSSWRLFASNDGETWATLDYVSNNTSVTLDNYALAYKCDFLEYGPELKVSELEVAEGKKISILPGLTLFNRPSIVKTGKGTLEMGGEGLLTVNPYRSFTVAEGMLDARNVTYRLGGTHTANHDAPFVVGTSGAAVAAVTGGSIYSVSTGSGDFSAVVIGDTANDSAYLYATNVDLTARGRIRIATAENSAAYVEKVGGDWSVEANHNYGRFYLGMGLNCNSEFYHRSGTLTTYSYICVGVNASSTSGRNYFEISGGTVTQGHNADIRIGDVSGPEVHNELAVKGGVLNARTDIMVSNNGRGILTIDGGEVDASNGNIYVGCSADYAKEGIVNLNGGVLKTKAFVGGSSKGQLNFDGGTVIASAGGNFLAEGTNLVCRVGANGGTIDNGANNIVIAKDFAGAGTVTLAGSGEVEFVADQTGADVTWRLASGSAKISEGVAFSSRFVVGGDSRLSIPVALDNAVSVSSLAFESGSTLGVVFGAKAISAGVLSLPESGEVVVSSPVGTPLAMGKYALVSAPGLQEDSGAKFAPVVADGLTYSYSLENGTLYLVVSGGNEAVWTGEVDGDLANPANWFLNIAPDGRTAIINVSVPTILTCSSSIAPKSIVFSEGSSAVTVVGSNSAAVSGVESVVNNSSSVHTFDLPVVFDGDVNLTWSAAPVVFAGGATGDTLVLSGPEEGGWHLKGTFGLQTWSGAPLCYIDADATVNVAGAASWLGNVAIEKGGTLSVGSYSLAVSESDEIKWALHYNRGHFIVRDTFTNTSSVTSSLFSPQEDVEAKGTNVFKSVVNAPSAVSELLWGKYGVIGTGFGKWSRSTYRFGTITCNGNVSPLMSYRSSENTYYFEESGSVVEEGEGNAIRFLEHTTFNMSTFGGQPTEMFFDCNISNVAYNGLYFYGDLVVSGGGRMTMASSRIIDCNSKTLLVNGATTLALRPAASLKANTFNISGGSTLLVEGAGAASLTANSISFSDDSTLKFCFTSRTVAPVLVSSAFQPKKVSVASAPKLTPSAGVYALTAFKLDPAWEIEAVDLPKWAKRVFVDEDGYLKVQVKSSGFRCIIR